MLKKMNQYLLKINQQSKNIELLLNSLQQNIKAEIQNEITKKYNQFKEKYYQLKQNLNPEKQAISYYINKYQLSLKQQNGQFKQDLSSLFKIIQQKLNDNKQKASFFQCQIHYSFTNKSSVTLSLLQVKNKLLENQIAEIKKILFYNPSMKKYMQKQLEQIHSIHQKFEQLFQNSRSTIYTPLLKLKCSFQQAVSNLIAYKSIQKLDLSIKQLNGIMTVADYKRLSKGIYQHNKMLTKITLRLSDMQFSQEKCDILKEQLKNCKHLKNIVIQNYYNNVNWVLFKILTGIPLKNKHMSLAKYGDFIFFNFFIKFQHYFIKV